MMQVTFHWVGGATFILSAGDLKIACDPVLCCKGTVLDFFWFKSRRIEEPAYATGDFDDTDLWLITHEHEDHLDETGLSVITGQPAVIANKNSAKFLEKKKLSRLSVAGWGETKTLQIKGYTIEVEAIPAIHGVNPMSAFFAGKGNGYYLTITRDMERLSLYITGDTVYKGRYRKLFRNRKTDIVIANMGAAKQGSWIMTLTLNAAMLVKMIRDVKPRFVFPVHYGTFDHYMETADAIRAMNDQRIIFVQPGGKTDIDQD